MSKKLLLGIILCMVLALAGCGGGEAEEPEANAGGNGGNDRLASVVNPWELYTQEEAEAALGVEVTADEKAEPEELKNPLGQKIVFYDPVTDDTLRSIQVSIVQNEGMVDNLKEQEYDVKQLYEETKEMLSEGAQPIEGFGDDAFWGTMGLHILIDNSYINVAVGNSDDPANIEFAKNIAETVLSRL